MERILRGKDLIDELSERTNFHKYAVKEFLEALDELIVENMNEATFDEAAEVYLTKGITIGAYRSPEREARDPRNGSKIVTPEKVIPYARFTQTYRRRINKLYEEVTEDDI